MITNKNNSGWILCPSNTFPGKFYYFNVLNGETAWSIGDTEKKIMKKDGGIPKVMDDNHHPEPSSPPAAYNPFKTDPILNQPKFTQMKHPTPLFGQSVFPKALPTKPEPNVIWTPIQIQVPIVLPENGTPNQVNQNLKRISQVTQMPKTAEELYQKPTLDIDNEVLVQSCERPLCQRFVNYEKPVISFNKNNRIEDKKLFDKFYTSTPIKKSQMSSGSMFTAIGSNINLSFEDLNPKDANQKPIIKKPTFNIEVPSEASEKVTIANTAPVQSKSNLRFEFLQSTVANQKMKIKKPILNFEVPSKTKKVAIAMTEQVQSNINPSFEALQPKVANQKPLIKKPTINIEVLSNSLQKVTIASNTKAVQSEINPMPEDLQLTVANQKPIIIKPTFKVEENCKRVVPKGYLKNPCSKNVPMSKKMLNNFDLRTLLVAKKKVMQDLVAKTNTGQMESKLLNTAKQESSQQTKKRVTFNFNNEGLENDYEDENGNFEGKYISTIEFLKELSGAKLTDQWCIVVDAQILLEEFSFLDSFVQIDSKCKLLIPSSVYSEVSAVSRGDCRGRTHVNHARNFMRRLTNAHIKVQSADVEGSKLTENDAILKCCLETMDQNIHLILITNNQEILTTAKLYHIPCYNIRDIKNGLIPKQKALKYKEMRITIPNDADSNIHQKGLTVQSFRQKLLDETDDLNEKEKEIIRRFKQIDANSKNNKKSISNSNTYENFMVTKTKISNGNSDISNINSMKSIPNSIAKLNSKDKHEIMSANANTNSMICSESCRIANAIPYNAITNSKNPNTNNMMLNTNCMKLNPNSRISIDNSMIPNVNSKNSVEDLMISKTHSKPTKQTVYNSNTRISNEISHLSTTNSQINPVWCASDNTETTVDVNTENLNFREKLLNKSQEKVKTTLQSEKKSNETVSCFFQIPTPKFDFRKIKNKLNTTSNVSSYLQNGRPALPFIFGENTKPVIEIKNEKPVFGVTEQIKPIFETNKTKEPQNSIFEMEKSNMAASKVEKPQIKQPLHRVKKNNDLSIFYVKNKIMENRLKERMDEWLCSFRQVMEETLSTILEKLPSSVMKSTPPWSLYDALKCTKIVYKDSAVTIIVDDLCGFLYDTDCRNGNSKKNLNPDDLIKSIGCGINLIKYLKNIPSNQHSDDLQEAEKCLLNMLNQNVDPACDINEPIVKTPVVEKSDDNQIRENFIKNRSEVINYLKKQYSAWKNYDENDDIETKITKTAGKDLLESEKKITIVKKDMVCDNSKKLTVRTTTKNVDSAKKNVGNPTTDTNFVEHTKTVSTNCNSAMKNVAGNFATKNIDKSLKTNTELDRKKTTTESAKNFSNNPTKNTEIEKTKVTQDKNRQKNIPKLTKTIYNKCADFKDVVTPENSKPKNSNSKETIQKYDKEHFGNNSQKYIGNKFKIDSQMLEVKITIPNNYNKLQNYDKNVRKQPERVSIPNETNNIKEMNLSVKHEPKLNSFTVKPTEMKKDINQETRNDIHKTIGNENGPKITRNANLIEEFEKRIKNKPLDLQDRDFSGTLSEDSSDCDNNDDEIHKRNNDLEFQTKCQNDRSDNVTDNLNYSEAANDLDLSSDSTTLKDNLNNLSLTDSYKVNENLNTHSNNAADCKLENVINATEKNDSKNCVAVLTDRKSYKDDMTYDSGLGNESPRMYSVIESFSSELESSLENIQKFIDGSIQEFRSGKLSEDRKQRFRLKAFEANYLLSKVINGLYKLSNKEVSSTEQNGDDSAEKNTSRNTAAIAKCLEHAQTLLKLVNMMLLVKEEDLSVHNSSMSLNASS